MQLKKRTLHNNPSLEEYGIQPSEKINHDNSETEISSSPDPSKRIFIFAMIAILVILAVLYARSRRPDPITDRTDNTANSVSDSGTDVVQTESEEDAVQTESDEGAVQIESDEGAVQTESDEDDARTDSNMSSSQDDTTTASTSSDEHSLDEKDELTELRSYLPGEWEDSYSQRAGMTIEAGDQDENEALYHVRIHWGSSAFETSVWTFSGLYDLTTDTIAYQDCTYAIEHVSESGETSEKVIYQNGTGNIHLEDGHFIWTDDMENAGEYCVFEKYTQYE